EIAPAILLDCIAESGDERIQQAVLRRIRNALNGLLGAGQRDQVLGGHRSFLIQTSGPPAAGPGDSGMKEGPRGREAHTPRPGRERTLTTPIAGPQRRCRWHWPASRSPR